MLYRTRATVLGKQRRVHNKHTLRKELNDIIRHHMAERGDNPDVERLLMKFISKRLPIDVGFFKVALEEEFELVLLDDCMELVRWSICCLRLGWAEDC